MADTKCETEIENSNNNRENCFNNENFAIICAFFEKFESQMNVELPNFVNLQEWLENTEDLHQGLKDLHIKLLRKLRKIVHETAWETALSKFCYSYSAQDAWEIERFGYKKSSLQVKLRVLKELLENQFERNGKLRTVMQNLTGFELRGTPIGHDKLGHAYWLTQDKDCNIRIYQEHLDEDIWQVVATNRNELIKLIQRLRGNEVVLPCQLSTIDEDTSSSSNSAPVVKPPPPEERDESQDAIDQILNDSKLAEEKVPNLKIRLNEKNEGKIESSVDERKVKPLIISQSKLAADEKQPIMPPKKRVLEEESKKEDDEDDKNLMPALKRPRPTLLDAKREKINRYEKFKDESDQEDLDEEEEEGSEEFEEEDTEDDEEGEEEADEDELDGEQESKLGEHEEEVGEAIEEKVLIVKGEGSGKDCEGIFFLNSTLEEEIVVGDVIEEEIMYVFGEGAGKDCLVGNDEIKSNTEKPENTSPVFYFGQPGCLKLSPLKLKRPEIEVPKVNDKHLKNINEAIDLHKDLSETKNGTELSGNNETVSVPGGSADTCIKQSEVNTNRLNAEDGQNMCRETSNEIPDKTVTSSLIEDNPIDYTSKTKKQLACSNKKNLEIKNHVGKLENELNLEKVKGSEIADDEHQQDKVTQVKENSTEKDDNTDNVSKIKDIIVKSVNIDINDQNIKGITKDTIVTDERKVLVEEVNEVTVEKISSIKVESNSQSNTLNLITKEGEKVDDAKINEKSDSVLSEYNKDQIDSKDLSSKILETEASSEKYISGSSSNRKRRLSTEKTQNLLRQISESETDLNSENLEDIFDGESENNDVGGKRARMRCKIVNTKIRKKVEATKQLTRGNSSSSSSDEDKPQKKPVVKKSNCLSPRSPEDLSKDTSISTNDGETLHAKDLTKDNKGIYTSPKKLAAKIEFLKQTQEAALLSAGRLEEPSKNISEINTGALVKKAYANSSIIPKKRISPKKIEDKIAELKQNITKETSQAVSSKFHEVSLESRKRSSPQKETVKDTAQESIDSTSTDNKIKSEDDEVPRKRTISEENENSEKIINLTTKPKLIEEVSHSTMAAELEKGPSKKRLVELETTALSKNEASIKNECSLPIKKKASSKLLNAIKNIEERKLKLDQQISNKSDELISETKVLEEDVKFKIVEPTSPTSEDRCRKRNIPEKFNAQPDDSLNELKKEKIDISTTEEKCAINNLSDEEKGKIRIVVKTCSDTVAVQSISEIKIETNKLENENKVENEDFDPKMNKESTLTSSELPIKTRTTRRGAPPPGSLAEPLFEVPIQTKRKGRHSGTTALQKSSVLKKAKKTESEEISSEIKMTSSDNSFNQNSDESLKPIETVESCNEDEVEEDTQAETEAIKTSEKEKTSPPVSSKKENADSKQDPPKQQRRKREIDVSNIIESESDVTPMRQSRRIAQLKIREEAERRKMEEIALKKMKEDLKKRKKEEKKQLDVDPTVSEPSSSDESNSEEDSKKKRLHSNKKKGNKKGWSSGTEDDEHEQDVDEDLLFRYPPSDHGSPLFHSDHEFSCESDLEDESQAVPMKRARTARKEGEEADQTQTDIDESCQKCGKGDHPEWILLCDNCDKGYHCSCLSPVLFIIPEGDWFCPPCQQEQLIIALESHLKEFDDLVEQRKIEEKERIRNEEIEARERERELELEALEAAEHALEVKMKKNHGTKSRRRKASEDEDNEPNEASDSEISNNEKENPEKKKRNGRNERRKKFSSSSSKSSSSSSAATDSDDEPIYKLRKRRQVNVSYRYNDYDDLINRAIKEEMDAEAGAGNLGRGKDIATIIEADKEEKARLKQQHEVSDTDEKENEEEPAKENNSESIKNENAEKKPEHIEEKEKEDDKDDDYDHENENDNDNENENEKPLKSKSKSMPRKKKKSRKLNSLDIDSDDDGSDEDFQTSSESEESESFSVSTGSDSSLEEFRKKSKKGRKVRKAARDRRKLRDFVVDESDDESDGDNRRKSKKKRPKYSDFTESDLDDEDESSASEDLGSSELCDDSTDSKSDDGTWRPGKHKKQKQTSKKKSSNIKSQTAAKPKVYVKPKKKPVSDDGEKSFKASGIKKKGKQICGENESSDSGTERKKTRGRRLFYIDDFDDEESSDGGIKPGVKRPDTPPEEREKFIKKQEEIKRQLAEKKAAEAKAAIENSGKTPPQKTDSLSTVPLSVIRAAKALDVDYLQRRGEDIPSDEEDDINEEDAAAAFGDALPDGLPDDMDDEAIAKMMEEEDFAQNQLKFPPGELIKPNKRNINMLPKSIIQSNADRLPVVVSQARNIGNINVSPQNLTLLQSALTQPPRPFQPARTQLEAHLQMAKHLQQNAPKSLVVENSESTVAGTSKPRGRRKKITPLRDPQEKAAAAAAANPSPKVSSKNQMKSVIHSPAAISLTTQHLPTNANLNVAQPPQLYKPPGNNTQPSVITRMPQLPPRARFPEQVSRYFSASPEQLRPPLRHGILNPHHILRTPYPPNGPPPLRSGPPPVNSPVNLIRQALNPKQSQFVPEPFRTRHSSAHLSSYRPPMYGNPGYPPPPQHPGSYPPGPYGSFYTPPPPPLAAHSSQRLTHTGIPSSVIVAAPPSSSHPPPVSSNSTSSPVIHHSPSTILRKTSPALPPSSAIKSSTILETFDSKRTSPTNIQDDELNANTDNPNQINPTSSSEFSGLVSYFSSQHDDFNS